ncbi:MAG: flagellar hook-length control protein FliK, partial [Desulfobulbia bacterium]
VLVKGEVLKANIYAQTHQASEVIDRNLPRLREILQGHGISVDELVVIFESETIDNFSSQYGQLSQGQNNHLKDQGNTQTSTRFENTIEEMLLSETEQESGVNLKI